MIKAVLLDLDDTLLRLDTDAFVKSYLEALIAFLAAENPTLAPEVIKKAILNGTRAAIRDLDPARLNAAVMSDSVSSVTGLAPDVLAPLFDRFFAEKYMSLGTNAAKIEGAAELIDHLIAAGLTVVIATNPLFPQVAIAGRLAWAGIDPEALPIALVTSLDNMHFTKPNPHYYEEILARIGVEADDALMVGDSLENDILPAARTGMSTFWIHWDRALPDGMPPPDGAGTLRDLDRCISEGWLGSLLPRPRTADQLAPRMLGNVAALIGLASELPADLWSVQPNPTEWSALEIVCHLRDSESRVQRANLLRILAEDNPFIAASVPPAPGSRDLSGESGPDAVRRFAEERAQTLDLLAKVTPEQWTRPARHSIFGPTNLLEMAHFTARHDRLHISQLCQLVGQCKG